MVNSDADVAGDADFFVSYTHSDEQWAEWIAWMLEDAGYQVVLQAWDFGPGAHFVAEMHRATQRAARTVAVVSAAYQASVFASEEWQAAWVADPDGRARRLAVFRVEDCPRDGLLRQVVSVDLFGVDRDTARTRLLTAVRGERRKPDAEPTFPSESPRPLTPDEPPLPRQPGVWRMPWPRNPNFVGRSAELTALRAGFSALPGGAAVMPQVLHGLGGVGKTQLAVEYAYRYATDYELVWWVPAEQPALTLAALAELAGQLGVGLAGRAQEAAAAVLGHLRGGHRFTRWLMIADNANVVSDLSGLLAVAGENGHLLITSRDPGWSAAARTVEVDVLARPDAVALLHARAPRLVAIEAEQIVAMLGDLPLAVEQAGAWLASSGMSTADYIDTVQHRTQEILAEGKPTGYPVPLAATWTAALDTVDELAVSLLRMWAFMGPEPIPADLLNSATAQALPAELAPLGDPLRRGRVVATLARLGLVRLVDSAVVVHRLVQAVLRDHTPVRNRNVLHSAVHRVLVAAAPAGTDDPAQWHRWAMLHPHALAARIVDAQHPDTRALTLKFCEYLRNAGDYPGSRALAENAHHSWLSTLGEDHPDTISSIGDLAQTLRLLGDYPTARQLQQDVLARRRHVLGEDDSQTVAAAANLAHTLRSLGQYSAARTMQQDVLARCRRLWGEDHPDTISAASHLAATLRLLGEYSAARTMQQDVLARRQRMLGDDHPDTLNAAANLAATLRSLGDYLGAREVEQDVMARRERIFGEDHPDTLTAAANLAATLRSLGESSAAREIQQDVLARRRRVFGERHPATIAVAANLAVTLRSLGEYSAAREIQQDILVRRRQFLGEERPHTLTAAANLAITLQRLGEYSAAREMQENVLARRRRLLGEEHPATLTVAANLGVTLRLSTK